MIPNPLRQLPVKNLITPAALLKSVSLRELNYYYVFYMLCFCCLKGTLFKGIILNIDGELKNNEKNSGVKTSCMVLRFPYDSANCIRFKGYALSSVIKSEHPQPELDITFNSRNEKLQV